ncbi:TIGR02147 family protein [Bdellovibrio sp. HCB2-146]|uniref:TIGR02147 family protein n=1 Tax=Bdellovibrio sp. HCB2-146 TaxID=3394362 RepID=UPI0039BC26E3
MRLIPSIFTFKTVPQFMSSYSQFLKEVLGGEKVKGWSKSFGIKSRITFRHVLKGHRKMSAAQIKKLKASLDMTESERANLDSKLKATEQGVSLSNTSPQVFYAPEYFFSTPIHTLILNLCGLPGLMTSEKIQAILQNAFSLKEIHDSIALLSFHHLIQRQDDGTLIRIFEGPITLPSGQRSSSCHGYYQKTFEMAAGAFDLPLTEREMQAFTFRLNSEDFPKAKDLIRKLRHDLSQLSSKEERSAVYQGAVVAFPIYDSRPAPQLLENEL